MATPTIYYMPCIDEATGRRLLMQMKRFGTDEGDVVDLPGLYSLRNYVALSLAIDEFNLTLFPIPAEKLLQGDKP
jgi:hypothetical protein